jgi:hypothetical protein
MLKQFIGKTTLFFTIFIFISFSASCSSSKAKIDDNPDANNGTDHDIAIIEDAENITPDNEFDETDDHIIDDNTHEDTDKNPGEDLDEDPDEVPDDITDQCKSDQCRIEETCFDDNQKNPSHLCYVCDISKNRFDWTPVESGTVCRIASGECDVAEKCDGINGDCPEDEFKPIDAVCGNQSETECDKPDSCDGFGVCKENFVAEFTACTDDNDDCNGAKSCDGSGSCVSEGPVVVCGEREVCNPDGGYCVCDEDNSFFLSPDETFCAFAGNRVYPTRQSKCYNATIEIPCPTHESGLPFFGQDAQYTDNPSTLTVVGDAPNRVVADSLTGLTWELDFDSNEKNWTTAKNYCESKGENWRLPTIKELMTTLHFDYSAPTCDTEYCPANSGFFWSVTEDIQDSTQLLTIYMYTGDIRTKDKTEATTMYARCVKGTPFDPTGTITDDGHETEPVATDSLTGLSWTKSMDSFATWEAALNSCESLNYGGYTDWRLPNIHELHSIIRYDLSSNATELPNIVITGGYWTSTTYSGLTDTAFYFDLTSGINYRVSKTHTRRFICVR